MSAEPSGVLYLVVGPSGAGKDSLLSHAAAALEGTHVFPRRLITRPHDAGGEEHEAVSAEAFAELRDAGRLALHWRAHGLDYGIGSEIGDVLATGRHVVCNVSRGVVDEARTRFRCFVVSIDASPEVRAARLQARGREAADDIAGRLSRDVDVAADATVINDGSLQAARQRFVAILSEGC